jgi:hypothetical protein
MHVPTQRNGNSGNSGTRFAVSYGVFVLIAVLGGCSPQSNESHETSSLRHASPEEQTVALARQYDCAVFGQEIDKSVGTNGVYSIDVQRVLRTNKRLAANCCLIDLVESGEQAEAIFDIEPFDTLILWSGKCVAKLECTTNLMPALVAGDTGSTWTVAFEIRNSRHGLQSSKGVKDDDSGEVWSVLVIEGKLLGLRKVF